MKKYFLSLGLALLVFGCSDESKVKSAALEGGQARFQALMREEIGKSVTGKENLQKTAVTVLTDRSEFSVDKIQINGDEATAVVIITTVPQKEREALVEIMAKLDPKKEMNFNVSNALNLIREQLQLARDTEGMSYKLVLRKSDGAWVVVP